MNLYPIELKQIGGAELLVVWNDGQRRQYTFTELRDECPCASCRERRAGKAEPAAALLPVLRPEEARPLRIVSMRPVGNYAYSIAFNDGHNTGIYTFELLRTLGREV
jgi:DUF971 family protein